MLTNSGDDIERQGQGAALVFQRNARSGTVRDRMQERLQLRVQRLFLSDGRFGNLDLRIYRRHSSIFSVLPDGKDKHLLPAIVEGNILSRLKKSQLAHSFRGNAAGGKVCDTPGLQFQTDVCNIGLT